MAIELQSFGARRNNQRQAMPSAELPKAQFWINLGYMIGEGTDGERFVSLPVGIPLDTMEKLSTRSTNADFAQFQAARNDLLDQMLNISKTLEPGDFHVIRTEGDLAIQIRRVNAEQAAPATDETNPYVRPKLFTAAAA